MAGDRPKLYKIRRCVKREDGKDEYYEWYDFPHGRWVDLEMDGFGFIAYQQAMKICESMKVKNQDPRVLYHSVVPAV